MRLHAFCNICQKWVYQNRHHHNEHNLILRNNNSTNNDLVYIQFGISKENLKNIWKNSITTKDVQLQTEANMKNCETQTDIELIQNNTSETEDTISISNENIITNEIESNTKLTTEDWNIICDFWNPSDILQQHQQHTNDKIKPNIEQNDLKQQSIYYYNVLCEMFSNVNFSVISYDVICLYLEQIGVNNIDLINEIYKNIVHSSVSSTK